MGYFLNIICEDLENIKDVNYINQKKQTVEEKLNYLVRFFNEINFKKYRFSTLEDCRENPNENYFYFLTNLTDMSEYLDESIHHDLLPFTSDFRGNLRHQNNLFLVLVDVNNTKNSLINVIKKLDCDNEKLIITKENELNNIFISNLINKNKKNTLNIVYDRWSGDNNVYYANLHPAEKDYYRYKIVVGLFRFYGLFNDIRSCNLNEVYENPNDNYYYFINCDNFNHHVMEVNTIPLPSKVRNCFNECKNFNIILLNEHEFESEDFIVYLNNLIRKEKLDAKRFYMLNNNSKLSYYKEKHNIDYNLYSLDFLVMFISTHMVEMGEPNYIPEKNGSFFLCHNRSPKVHRYVFLCMLMKDGILEEIDWSLIMGWYHKKEKRHEDENYYSEFFNKEEKLYYADQIKYLTNIDIKKSKYELSKTWFDDTSDNAQIFWNEVYERKTFEDSYVNIVTESCYSPKEIHISEKSLKPFYFYQFPIFLSSYNHIKYLKERFKFDVFDDIIDHSYDDEPDNKIRMQMVIKEIKRIEKNKDFFKEFYKNNQQRFISNKEKIVDIYNSKNDVNFFHSLINKQKEIKKII